MGSLNWFDRFFWLQGVYITHSFWVKFLMRLHLHFGTMLLLHNALKVLKLYAFLDISRSAREFRIKVKNALRFFFSFVFDFVILNSSFFFCVSESFLLHFFRHAALLSSFMPWCQRLDLICFVHFCGFVCSFHSLIHSYELSFSTLLLSV